MPPRSSRSRKEAATPVSAPLNSGHDIQRALTYHASSITIIWILILSLAIGFSFALLGMCQKMRYLVVNTYVVQQEMLALRAEVASLKGRVVEPTAPPAQKPPETAPTSAGSSTSPNGKLMRGSFSPDQTKFAGYEEVTKGKIGIAVEIPAEKRTRYIEIFNPLTQSTGAGTEFANQMSVRWTDNQTIEYDMLSKVGGAWVKETRTVKIFF